MRAITFAIVLFWLPVSLAQKIVPNGRVTKSHPSVYITFDHQGKIASMSNGQMEDAVWLRLRNNTRWPIILDRNGVPSKARGDAVLFWDVLCEGREPAIVRCHDCTSNSLRAGHHILFTVPRADLARGCAIRVKFSYGWEGGSGEPEHFVYFYSSDLPAGTSK